MSQYYRPNVDIMVFGLNKPLAEVTSYQLLKNYWLLYGDTHL